MIDSHTMYIVLLSYIHIGNIYKIIQRPVAYCTYLYR